MRFYTKQHQFYCGIDLHASVMYLCIINTLGKVVLHKNIQTKPKSFLRLIKPYRDNLVVGCECMLDTTILNRRTANSKLRAGRSYCR